MKHAAIALLLLGCGTDPVLAPDCAPLETAPAAAVAKPAVPGPEVLCKLQYGISTPQDAIELLGKPASFDEDARWSSLFYYYDGGRIVLFLSFDERVLDSANLDNAPYPECWREDL